MIVALKQFSNDDVLAGLQTGKRMLARLVEVVEEPDTSEPLFLDFEGIALATGSFLREGPFALRRMLRAKRSNLYPIIANPSQLTIEELEMFLRSENDAVFACTLDGDGRVSDLRVLGVLDEKQALTLAVALKNETVTANSLVESGADPGVKATAWNNRLSALALKGLIMEAATGRTKVFRVPVNG